MSDPYRECKCGISPPCAKCTDEAIIQMIDAAEDFLGKWRGHTALEKRAEEVAANQLARAITKAKHLKGDNR